MWISRLLLQTGKEKPTNSLAVCDMLNDFSRYAKKLIDLLEGQNWRDVEALAVATDVVWQNRRQVFVCGNGGSAANAIHIANDLLYGVRSGNREGIRVEALSANTSVLTCLANDIGYEEIFSQQLLTKGNAGDLLLVLSGSGNSPNVVRALEVAESMGMVTFAIVGYSGGRCREVAQNVIHFKIDDMQISEDCQLVVGHMCMQWLRKKYGND